MRLITSLWIALASLAPLQASERPRYGGELHIELRAKLQNLDVSDVPGDALEAEAKRKVLGLVFETREVTYLPSAGDARVPRTGATWHDGRAVEPLKLISDGTQSLQMRERLVRNTDGAVPAGTGPFRIKAFDPGKRLRLEAHTGHWGGRPFLDAIEITFGRSYREQALAFDVGAADVIEVPWNETRKARQRAGHLAQSSLIELLALTLDASKVPQTAREAVAFALDRTSIHSVLLQKQGEPTAALLPQWLSGWAFAFPIVRNVEKARKLAANASLSFAYDRQDPLMRAIGERIALNAAEAGLSLKPAATPASDARLLVLPVDPDSAWQAKEQLAAIFRAPKGQDAFTTERFLLEGARIIPLFHLPASYYVSSRVRNWQGDWVQSDRWNLANVWLREPNP